MMILNILPNSLRRYSIPYCPSKVPVFPELSSPQFPFHFGVFLEYYTRAYALQHSHYSAYAIPRRKRYKNVYMVFYYFHGVNLKPMICGYLLKHPLRFLPNITSQNPLPVLRSPYQMILRVISRMTGSLHLHALFISHSSVLFPCLRQGGVFLPPLQQGQPPPTA